MRVLAEIPHPQCKITVFHWNNRYLIKFEKDLLEQTFKVSEFDLTDPGDIQKMLTPTFIERAMQRFLAMEHDLHDALENIDF